MRIQIFSNLPPEDPDNICKKENEAHVGREALGALIDNHPSDLENKAYAGPNDHTWSNKPFEGNLLKSELRSSKSRRIDPNEKAMN